ncbi:cyclic nucleotide-binding domain-containing protein [Hymenobacter sp. BT770]|uniref:cyclic nucleotide-binding domain-containing protein n=1 Tax=Hymenobacter sp. BT770 TaxID=2886942 RepID=UPI001D10CE86|nr:cyclic nucleotide-binding domain-containing protein [Hymenobacter sp. BT770]MCC3153608.1 cyclic nucleotide-binding domain-containing protein [Hymenobacter sp. BT770]MDO3415926.1 cyclic nucleotide-binding domain-containing protein [Hymenobacter sp. BT770]
MTFRQSLQQLLGLQPGEEAPLGKPLPADSAPALVAALGDPRQHRAAAAGLQQLGPTAIPALAAALPAALATDDPALLRRLVQAAALFNTPASRQLMVELIRNENLFARAAALRATTPRPEPAEAAVFEAVVQRELQLARQLLHGQATAPAPLAKALAYELQGVQSRLFGLLVRLYSPQLIAQAQRTVAHAAPERQATALELLRHLIPAQVYQGLLTLLDPAPAAAKARAFDELLGPPPAVLPPVAELVAVQGLAAFADWTLAQALQTWKPTATTVKALLPHLRAQNRLVRESAVAALRRLAETQPIVHKALLHHWPHAAPPFPMLPDSDSARVSAAERVRILQHTALFAETPEHVLSAIVPIMNEVGFAADEEIFAKGDQGGSLFIVHEGTVGIYNGGQQLTTFEAGDFFGELALLDAEPRSATARALEPVMALRLDQDDFYDVMGDRPEVLRNILRVLCQRLRHQNDKMQAMA